MNTHNSHARNLTKFWQTFTKFVKQISSHQYELRQCNIGSTPFLHESYIKYCLKNVNIKNYGPINKMSQKHVVNVFLWCLASIYLFAFISLYVQIPGKYLARYTQTY